MDRVVAVLDTSAVLAYVKGELGAKVVDNVIDKSIMAVINMIEAVIVLGRKNPQRLSYYQNAINELVSHKYETDSKLLFIASEISIKYREKHNLSLGDCCCLALGKYLNLPIYTGDKLWRGLESKLNIEIKFIRGTKVT